MTSTPSATSTSTSGSPYGPNFEIGDVIVSNLDIITVDGATMNSLFAQCSGFYIFEDIESPTLSAEFHFVDGLNMLKRFPITGKEYFSIKFNTPTQTVVSANLYVNAVTDLRVSQENQEQMYTIHAASKELFYNAQTTMEKSYNDTITNIITDIVKNKLKSSKTLTFGQTQGAQKIVCPRISPLQMVEHLRTRAASASVKSASWYFYESFDGFHLTTIEDLFKAGTNPPTYYKHTALQDGLQSQWAHFDIVDYAVGQQFNILDNVKLGSYNGLMESWDLLSKTLKTNTYNNGQFSQFTNLDQGQPQAADPIRSVPQAAMTLWGQDVGQRRYNFQDTAKPITYIDQFIPKKLGFLGPNFTSSYDLYINGDSSLHVGQVISVQVIKTDKLTDTAPTYPEPLTNGNYLIIKMRHTILISAKRPKYTAVITVIKGTYINQTAIPGIGSDNTTTIGSQASEQV